MALTVNHLSCSKSPVYLNASAGFRCRNLSTRCKFLSSYSTIEIYRFLKLNKNSVSEVNCVANGVNSDSSNSVELHKADNELRKQSPSRNKNDVAEDCEEENSEGERVDVMALGRSLHRAKIADDVDEILRDMGQLPLRVYSSIIRGFGKEKRMDSAVCLVEWLRRKKGSSQGPNLFIYNSLLGAAKQSGQYDAVGNILNDMAEDGVQPNAVTYNTLMSIYIQQGSEVDALDLFGNMPSKGVAPTPASYSTALLAYRRLGDGFGALKFFVETKDKYIRGEIGKDSDGDWEKELVKLEDFTIRICHQVMRKWLVKNENEMVSSMDLLKLLAELDNTGLQIGCADYERLVWACTHENHCIVAKELYKRIRERYTEISLSVCNHVIWLMGKAKKWWAALEIYGDLLDKGPEPNNMSYELIVSHFNILLTAARKKGIWKWGVRLIDKMEEKGLKPGTREWNAVLVACSKASQTDAAVQIFRRMVECGEKPTIISYGALLSALEKGKLYDEALQVWKHMTKVGVEPNLYAYTIMASIYAAQGKFNIVNSIIREMASVGVGPTVVTYNAIISACARNNMVSVTYEWFQHMRIHNISPNEVTYEMLIEALANDGKPRLAYELYLRAQNEGMSLSPKAYNAVALSSRAYGATVDLTTLGHRPPDKEKKIQVRKTLSEFQSTVDVPMRNKPFDVENVRQKEEEFIK